MEPWLAQAALPHAWQYWPELAADAACDDRSVYRCDVHAEPYARVRIRRECVFEVGSSGDGEGRRRRRATAETCLELLKLGWKEYVCLRSIEQRVVSVR